MTGSDIKVKDIYETVQGGGISKYHFMLWLRMYGHKHWSKGWNGGFEAGYETGARDGK